MPSFPPPPASLLFSLSPSLLPFHTHTHYAQMLLSMRSRDSLGIHGNNNKKQTTNENVFIPRSFVFLNDEMEKNHLSHFNGDDTDEKEEDKEEEEKEEKGTHLGSASPIATRRRGKGKGRMGHARNQTLSVGSSGLLRVSGDMKNMNRKEKESEKSLWRRSR